MLRCGALSTALMLMADAAGGKRADAARAYSAC